MKRKFEKNNDFEFRFYEVPEGEPVLALLGDEWLRPFGLDSDTGAMIDDMHFHNLFEVGYCAEGLGEVVSGKNKYHFESGYYTFIPPNYPHITNSFGKSANSWEYLFFDASKLLRNIFPNNDQLLFKILQALNNNIWCFSGADDKKKGDIISAVFDECRKREKASSECIQALLGTLFIYLYRDTDTEDIEDTQITKSLDFTKQNYIENIRNVNGFARIINSLDFIDHNYMNELRVEDLAERAGLSVTHYRRQFCEFLDMPPMEYVNFIRIRKACELLLRTDYTMGIIAEKVGYVCESTFNRNFRKMLSISPNHFRKNGSTYLGKELGKK